MQFGDSIWNDNQLLLSANIFKDMKNNKITFKQLAEFMENFITLRNSFFIGSPHNTEIYLQRNRERFAFAIHYPGKWAVKHGEFSLWHETYNALGNCLIDENSVPNDEFINWVDEKINNKLAGKINCSDCGKLITKDEIAGRYFAGQYCQKCWEGKWKEIEAKETYN